jgi:hypothetical protein
LSKSIQNREEDKKNQTGPTTFALLLAHCCFTCLIGTFLLLLLLFPFFLSVSPVKQTHVSSLAVESRLKIMIVFFLIVQLRPSTRQKNGQAKIEKDSHHLLNVKL